MKRASRRTGGKTGKPKRKTIMRHSREGVRPGKRKAASKAKAKAKAGRKPTAKTKSKAKPVASRAAKRRTTVKSTTPKKSPGSTARRRGALDMIGARGIGADSAGQSGDTEGLSQAAQADSESVEELVEEGQAFEAGVISGVEDAPPAGKRGIRTRQVPEDDVPLEYLDEK